MCELSPIKSELTTTEEAEAYDHWFRAKVQAALVNDKSKVAHEEVMARVRELIESKRRTA